MHGGLLRGGQLLPPDAVIDQHAIGIGDVQNPLGILGHDPGLR